jgi:hypothetical protein
MKNRSLYRGILFPLNWVIILLVLLSISKELKSQIVDDYIHFSKNFDDETRVILKHDKELGARQRINYLGKIVSSGGETFKVFCSFTNYSGKGVSRLIFVSQDRMREFVYSVDMPEELPIKIEGKTLLFKRGTMLFDEPFKLICSSEYGCIQRTY